MTITITILECATGVDVLVDTNGMTDATGLERKFAVAIVEGIKVTIPVVHALLGGTRADIVEREKPTTATE